MSLISVVPVLEVRPDPKQPRTHFKDSALQALAVSLKKVGQRQPITVRALRAGAKHRYEIIDGERRWRACVLTEIPTIRVDIEIQEPANHAAQHLLSLASNFMREGHTHMEISHALRYQVDSALEAGRTRAQAIQEIKEAVGKSETWVSQYLHLQDLHPELQALMHPDTSDKARVRFGEAVVLAGLAPTKQKSVYKALLKVSPSARTELARKLSAEVTGEPRIRHHAEIKGTTARFITRMAVEVDRVLDFKQAEFVEALQLVPKADLEAFHRNLGLLLESVRRATKGAR